MSEMWRGWRVWGTLLGSLCLATVAARPAEPTAAERGQDALLHRNFIPAMFTLDAYANAWRHWGEGLREAPLPYADAFRRRYGLAPALTPDSPPYPLGLREAPGVFSKGLSFDCLICHGGAIAGHSYLGLGNASLDFQALYEDLAAASGRSPTTPFPFSNVRGTTEAGSMSAYLLSFRTPDLKLRLPPLDLGRRDCLCEDVPALWLMKKKRTLAHTGNADVRSVRALMQFMLHPLNGPDAFAQAEPAFADIRAYLLTLQPPRYPFAIDAELASRGEKVFQRNCAGCHGTYGAAWTYPNKIVPIDVIGTDRTRLDGFSDRAGFYYNKSWFAREQRGWLADEYAIRKTNGYQAPPLDGIWATAPYFHNGSVPTVYQVLESRTRPRIFTRSYDTGTEAYDPRELGWKVRVLDQGADPGLPAIERRKVYDTTQPGRGNGGHTFGDKLTEAERWAVIEYLKTL